MADAKKLDTTYWLLRLTYGLVPVIAGLDKFTNLLVDWKKYMAPAAASMLPVAPATFMAIVGVIEVVAGLVVLSGITRLGGYLVGAWLALIACNLLLGGFYDIAVRDLVMAIGSVSLALVTEARGELGVGRESRGQPGRIVAPAGAV